MTLIRPSLQPLRDEYTRTIAPAAETLILERTLSDLVNQAYALNPAQIALMWQTAPPRMPISPPGDRDRINGSCGCCHAARAEYSLYEGQPRYITEA